MNNETPAIENENYVRMQSTAIQDLQDIASILYEKSEACYELNMVDMGRNFFMIFEKLRRAIKLVEQANNLAFNEHMNTMNQSSKNTLDSILTMVKIAEATEENK